MSTESPNYVTITQTNKVKPSTIAKYLLIGGGVGAIVALLFAPKSGRELREDIADMVHREPDYSREAASQIEAGASEYYEVERESASKLYDAAAKQADSLAGGS